MDAVRFTINGQLFTVNGSTDGIPVDTSLNTFIRDRAHLKGTKFMCREGGCGACVVTLSGLHPVTRKRATWAANSCLVSVFSCHELDVRTVEGIGGKRRGSYHPLQQRLAEAGGSQCGYCSPGMVMTMYGLLASNRGDGPPTEAQIEAAFDGNVCRCTGYRPILEAFRSFAHDATITTGPMADIEDLTLCPAMRGAGQGSNEQPAATKRYLAFRDGRKWFKVTSLGQALEVLESIKIDEQYMLVAGNTAHGVYRRPDGLRVFLDVSRVRELREHRLEPKMLHIGSGVPLAELIDILTIAADSNLGFAYCSSLADHLRKVANTPVRNVGTIAGNLMIKHQHPEFPSDLFLLLEAVEATIVIVSSVEKTIRVSPLDFLKLNMSKKIIRTIELPPHDHVSTTFRSYKIMPVAQNSRATVNAALMLRICPETRLYSSIRICYGGINPSFVHATKTEVFLQGKSLGSGETLAQALHILSGEVKPDAVLPDAAPAYRKHLTLALLYRFALSVHPETVGRLVRTGAHGLERPAVSSGQQSYETHRKRWPLTQSVPKLEALAQCAGEAEFINDMPVLPNELHGAFVLATELQSRIVQIDATEALAVPGVAAFLCAKDVPGFNNFMPLEMGAREVEEIFCSGQVNFVGQIVGMVCAESFELANRAAALVRIEYRRTSNRLVMPTVQDVYDALDFSRVTDQPYDRHGARYQQAREGPITVSGRFDLRGQYHYPLETQACLCVPQADGMDVYTATQWFDHVQIAVSQALGVQESALNVWVRRVGGAYGLKLTYASQIACACAVAAQQTGRPVRMILPLETAMSATGKRAGSVSEYEVSFDRTGRISKLSHTYIHDDGAATNLLLGSMTSDHFKNCYRTDRWKLRGKVARTDVPPNTWARAPGTSEGIAMVENIMEHIAHATGLDSVDVRMVNIARENKMHTLLPRFRRQVDYDGRRGEIETFNRANRWHKRGIAIVPMQYPLESNAMKGAVVSLNNDDGTAQIVHGGIEMGQGINTKLVQVAAHLLAIPMEKIVVKPTSSLLNANSNASMHSQATDSVAMAVKKCCEILLERLKPYRSLLRPKSWEEMVRSAALDEVNLQASYFATPADIRPYTIWGLACGEVELDVLTGQVLVRRVDILEDVGESMNPGIDVGQIEGAFVMGLGYYLTEALVYDPRNGALVNNRSWNYKVPGYADIPVDFRVSFLAKSVNEGGVLRAKATGEPALSLSPVIVHALRNCIKSARQDAGLPDVWLHMGSGMTPERICSLLEHSIEQFKLE
ncbi:xanthine dehydrogenase/oxidase-like [Anopheles albimanus]|uniref:FAD-binding PCMH-type domain-containing protein n=1 Tax=Anopheles albimanus TaxID=7167 RepID=A0A182FDS5_ANOAL|nr:xanthine dehydrogenase/oxidase-like [Anopheles albimanus]